jgi:hypothetical protein
MHAVDKLGNGRFGSGASLQRFRADVRLVSGRIGFIASRIAIGLGGQREES